MLTEKRQPFWLKCPHLACGHVWIGAYLPLDASKFSKLLSRAACPKCAEEHGILVATDADVEDRL